MQYNLLNQINNPEEVLSPKVLEVYFHVVRRKNKTGGYMPNEVLEAFNVLQTDFNPFGISFSWDGCIDYINRDNYYSKSVLMKSIFNINGHNDGIDIYLYPASHKSKGGSAYGVGETSEFYVSGKRDGEAPSALNSIISHEMGHVLFLWHTHQSTVANNSDFCLELVNGTNSSYCGDFVVDTPADPNIMHNVDSDCQWLGSGFDSNDPPEPYNPDTKNIMSLFKPSCRTYFTPGQAQKMHNAIYSLPFLQACIVSEQEEEFSCDCDSDDIVLSGFAIADNDFYVGEDLIISEGSTIVLSGKLTFSQDHGIKVMKNAKLILNGAILTSCDDTWNGIEVVGGNSDYDISIQNGSIIEYTSNAAVSMKPPLPYPERTNHGNGILHAENSYFNNCFRMAEFIAYQPSYNSSYIKNCIQTGGKLGVTSWNSGGMIIEDNEFNDITQDCIVFGDAYGILEKNKFDGSRYDISIDITTVSLGSRIFDNDFYGDGKNIIINNSAYVHTEIVGNQFWNANVGRNIELVGQNKTLIDGNSNRGEIGVFGWATSDTENIIEHNTFSNTLGLHINHQNEGLEFLDNCFHTSNGDVYIRGSVAYAQREYIGGAALNCFSHSGDPTSTIPTIFGQPAPFNYYEAGTPNLITCFDALNVPSTVNIINVPNVGENDFGCDDIISPESEFERDEIVDMIVNGDFATARSVLDQISSFSSKELMFLSYVAENDLASAQSFLQSLRVVNEEQVDFKTLQTINLERLQEPDNYVASSNIVSNIETIANKTHRYSGLANALHFVLSGNHIVYDASINGEIQQRKIADSNIIERDFEIFPNPVQDQLVIQLNPELYNAIVIYNSLGHIVYNGTVTSVKETVDFSNLTNGIYFVVLKGAKYQEFEKIIVSR